MIIVFGCKKSSKIQYFQNSSVVTQHRRSRIKALKKEVLKVNVTKDQIGWPLRQLEQEAQSIELEDMDNG